MAPDKAFIFSQIFLIFFLFLHKNILEAPWQGASNEYPQHMFSWRNKKNTMRIPSLIWSNDTLPKYHRHTTIIPIQQTYNNFVQFDWSRANSEQHLYFNKSSEQEYMFLWINKKNTTELYLNIPPKHVFCFTPY